MALLSWICRSYRSKSGRRSTAGSWRWGGVYGHHWFVDPEAELPVVVLTNTTPIGMSGDFPNALRDAVYRATSATGSFSL